MLAHLTRQPESDNSHKGTKTNENIGLVKPTFITGHPMKIKICGVTSPDVALLAADLGVTHIGLNFYPPSPRYLHTEHALAITQALHQLSAAPLLVGVFVNENADTIQQKMDMYGLDIAQLSGNETTALSAHVWQFGSFVSML